MSNKLISIIIPCYNVEQYINRCFESISKQTIGLDGIEIIFVNDASTDKTLEYLLSIEKQYEENVLVVNFEENRKQGAARNVGMSYATGKYIAFVDADDFIEPEMFEYMIKKIEQYDCDFVQCRYDFVGNFMKQMISKPWDREWCANLEDNNQRKQFMIERMNLVSVCDKVYKRDFLINNDIFFIEGLRCEDIFFSHLVFVYAKSSYCTNEVFYHYWYNERSTMRQTTNTYQLDKIDVSEAFLSVCIQRGLMNTRKEEVEWLFLKNYYIYMLWEVFHVFPERSYELYCKLKKNIKDWIPDYKNHPYRFLEGFEFENIMLKLLDFDMNEQDFEKIRKDIVNKINMPV